jgi:hypothetical protein
MNLRLTTDTNDNAQSIIQVTTYVIFGFMLRKRFRMSGD